MNKKKMTVILDEKAVGTLRSLLIVRIPEGQEPIAVSIKAISSEPHVVKEILSFIL